MRCQIAEPVSFEECGVSNRCGIVCSVCEQCPLIVCRGPRARVVCGHVQSVQYVNVGR